VQHGYILLDTKFYIVYIARILGPTALQQYAEKGEGLPSNSRPLYSLTMSGLVICFTGFRKKDELVSSFFEHGLS
jgi:hypothetical protein